MPDIISDSRNSVRRNWLLLVSFTLAFLSLAGKAQNATLDFIPQSVGKSGEVRFFAKSSGAVSPSSLTNASLVPSARTEHGYVVSVDSSSYQQDKNHRFVLDIYVALKPDDANADLDKFSVREDQAGMFSDGWATVTLKVTAHGNTDATLVKLPVHCRDSENLRLATAKTTLLPMGSESTPAFDISNALVDFHVTIASINGVTVADDDCPKCWSNHTAMVSSFDLAPGHSMKLNLDLQPNTIRILKDNLLPNAADAQPHQITVTVLSTAENGGSEVRQDFDLPIRFKPAPPFLALSLILGIVIGIAMRALITRKVDWLDFSFQVLLAFVVWLILIITQTKLSVRGYEFDPTSLLAAGLITLLVAAGSSVGSKIAEEIRKP